MIWAALVSEQSRTRNAGNLLLRDYRAFPALFLRTQRGLKRLKTIFEEVATNQKNLLQRPLWSTSLKDLSVRLWVLWTSLGALSVSLGGSGIKSAKSARRIDGISPH
jgi:hypothetical protein